MKKIILILCIIAMPVLVFAEDINSSTEIKNNDINLELTQPQKTINLGSSKSYPASDYSKTEIKNDIQDVSKQDPNAKCNVKFGKKKTYKDISVGSECSHTMTSDTYKSSGTVYTEYEKKNFKINSSYTRNTTPNQANQDKGTISVTPEYKLNKHVSVQNKYSSNINDRSNKGEVKVNVKPFKDDRMDMGVGVGQKYGETGTSSQVNFTTNFKW